MCLCHQHKVNVGDDSLLVKAIARLDESNESSLTPVIYDWYHLYADCLETAINSAPPHSFLPFKSLGHTVTISRPDRHRSGKATIVLKTVGRSRGAVPIFTALHRMQTRSSDENSVCPSVCLSVRPSVKRMDCDKTEERSIQIFIPYEKII